MTEFPPPSRIFTIKRLDKISLSVNSVGFRNVFPDEAAVGRFLNIDWQELVFQLEKRKDGMVHLIKKGKKYWYC